MAEPSQVWNGGPELQSQTHPTVAQDALSGMYEPIGSAG